MNTTLVVLNVKNAVLDAEFKNIIMPDDFTLYPFFFFEFNKKIISLWLNLLPATNRRMRKCRVILIARMQI